MGVTNFTTLHPYRAQDIHTRADSAHGFSRALLTGQLIFRNFLDAEAKKAGYEGVFKWDEWCFSVNQVCAIVFLIA